MYFQGKKVKDISAIDVIYTSSDCEICGGPGSYYFKVTFDDSWDDTIYVDVCGKCLIEDGWFFDMEDVIYVLGEEINIDLY